jgi:hypothetical protein
MSGTGRLAFSLTMAKTAHKAVMEGIEIFELMYDDEEKFDENKEVLTFTCGLKHQKFKGNLEITYGMNDGDLDSILLNIINDEGDSVKKGFKDDIPEELIERVKKVFFIAIDLLEV